MCACNKSLADTLEDLIEDAILDEDWNTSEFLQDLLEVCLTHRQDVALSALHRLVEQYQSRCQRCKEVNWSKN